MAGGCLRVGVFTTVVAFVLAAASDVNSPMAGNGEGHLARERRIPLPQSPVPESVRFADARANAEASPTFRDWPPLR